MKFNIKLTGVPPKGMAETKTVSAHLDGCRIVIDDEYNTVNWTHKLTFWDKLLRRRWNITGFEMSAVADPSIKLKYHGGASYVATHRDKKPFNFKIQFSYSLMEIRLDHFGKWSGHQPFLDKIIQLGYEAFEALESS